MSAERSAGSEVGRPRSRRLRALGLAVAALVVGMVLGRFVTYGSDRAPADAPVTDATTDAIGTLEQRVAADPRDLPSWVALGTAYVRRSTESGDPAYSQLADKAFRQAESLQPGLPAVRVGRGAVALLRHEFDEALRLGTEAHQSNRLDPDALAVMVDASIELGRYEDAERHLQTLLDARPALAAYTRTSYLRELHGDVGGARQALHQADAAGAGARYDLATVAALLGNLALGEGDLDAAVVSYDRALELSPDLRLAQIGRARVDAARGDRQAAIRRLQQVVERYPEAGAVTLLAELQALEGDTAGARANLDLVRAIHRLQQDAGTVTDLEEALFEADHGNPARAVELARSAQAARPTVVAADAMAWSLHRAGRSAEALPWVDQALRLGSRDASFHFHAASVFASTGQPERAAEHLRVAFAGSPWFSFSLQDEARGLARQLGVPIPAAAGTAPSR